MKARLKILCLLSFIVLSFPIFSQQVIFEKWYGSTYNDIGSEAVKTVDGGYLIAGIYQESTYNDVWLIKTNSNGDTLWSKKYGENYWDNGYSITATYDGNYIIGGRKFSSSNTATGQAYLIKVAPDGNVIWDKDYGSADKDGCNSIICASDSGYVFAGQYNYSYFWVMKADSGGTQNWSSVLMSGNATDLIETSDNKYLAVGVATLPNFDFFVAKFDPSTGDTLWTKQIGGSGNDVPYSVCELNDGNFLISGYTNSFGNGGNDVYLVKLSPDGDTLATRTYGSTGDDFSFSICKTNDNGFLIAGQSDSFGGGGFDAYVIKIDSNLDTVWTSTYGGTGNDYFNKVMHSEDNKFVLIGNTKSFGNGGDVYFVKIQDNNGTTDLDNNVAGNTIPDKYYLLQNYPNPFNPTTTIEFSVPKTQFVTLKIFDILGREVSTLVSKIMSSGIYSVQFNGNNYNSGTYFYQLREGSFQETRKFVLIK